MHPNHARYQLRYTRISFTIIREIKRPVKVIMGENLA